MKRRSFLGSLFAIPTAAFGFGDVQQEPEIVTTPIIAFPVDCAFATQRGINHSVCITASEAYKIIVVPCGGSANQLTIGISVEAAYLIGVKTLRRESAIVRFTNGSVLLPLRHKYGSVLRTQCTAYKLESEFPKDSVLGKRFIL